MFDAIEGRKNLLSLVKNYSEPMDTLKSARNLIRHIGKGRSLFPLCAFLRLSELDDRISTLVDFERAVAATTVIVIVFRTGNTATLFGKTLGYLTPFCWIVAHNSYQNSYENFCASLF